MHLDKLKQTHPSYKRVAEQANFYYESYVGGFTYKDGAHLMPYLGENGAPGNQYQKRLDSTPLDNHVQTTIDIYRSFLFRELPRRQLGILANNPLVEQFIEDTDQEGQSLNSFLKTANDLAMVTGSVWILVDKPSYRVETQAEEIANGIRAYACVYSPQNVLDWHHERAVNGKLELKFIKVKESESSDTVVITCWYPEMVQKFTLSKTELGEWDAIISVEEYDNPLGYIPFVQHAPLRSPVKGVGNSLVADVAAQQKYIYNLLSELEQTIRISGHPTLAKTASTDATAGAGGIVTMQEDMDPGLKPYLLQPSNTGISGILEAIRNSVETVQRMTHTSAIQATNGSAQSGVALQTERQLLNAKLSDLADTLRETELAMWSIWLDWQALAMPEDFEIAYPDTFDIRDKSYEMQLLLTARSSGVNSVEFQRELDRQIIELMVEDTYIASDIVRRLDNQPATPDMGDLG